MKQELTKVLDILQKTKSQTMLAAMRGNTKFQILISTILSARAKDAKTTQISQQLFKEYGTPEKLAKADAEKVKQIIKPIGFYNVKTKNIIAAAKKIKEHGKVPDTINELIKLPGVGRKVANCVLVYGFGKQAIPVDTHVHRISNRLGWVRTKTPEQTEKELEKIVPRKHWKIINETFVTHGQTICTPISPYCSKCPIEKHCKKIAVERSR